MLLLLLLCVTSVHTYRPKPRHGSSSLCPVLSRKHTRTHTKPGGRHHQGGTVPRVRPVRGVHRCARGRGAPRRREPVHGQGSVESGREREQGVKRNKKRETEKETKKEAGRRESFSFRSVRRRGVGCRRRRRRFLRTASSSISLSYIRVDV